MGDNKKNKKQGLIMNVLITGISGFVGEYLAHSIQRKYPKAKIFGIERAAKPFELFPDLNKKVKILICDITNAHDVENKIREISPDKVFHLAGFASASGKDRKLIFDVNVLGTTNILKALEKLGKKIKVVLISTSYVYGNTSKPAKESGKTSPVGIYAESKRKMEMESFKIAKNSKNLDIIIARSVNHIGPGQKKGFVVPDFSSQIAGFDKEDEIFVGNLEAKRDFLDVLDVVEAYIILAEKGKSNEIYNISSKKTIKIEDILNKLIKISQKNIIIKKDPEKMRASDIRVNCLDNSKIKKLGWKKKNNIDKTLKKTYLYWRKNK